MRDLLSPPKPLRELTNRELKSWYHDTADRKRGPEHHAAVKEIRRRVGLYNQPDMVRRKEPLISEDARP